MVVRLWRVMGTARAQNVVIFDVSSLKNFLLLSNCVTLEPHGVCLMQRLCFY